MRTRHPKLNLILLILLAGMMSASFGASQATVEVDGKLSPDLQRKFASNLPGERVTAIVDTGGPLTAADRQALQAMGGIIVYEFRSTSMCAVRIPIRELPNLTDLANVLFVTANRQARSAADETRSHLKTTTGAAQAVSGDTLGGNRIGIAVLDTGVSDPDREFDNADGSSRIVGNVGFVGLDQQIHINTTDLLYTSTPESSTSGTMHLKFKEDKSQVEQTLTLHLHYLPQNRTYTVRFDGIDVHEFTLENGSETTKLEFAVGGQLQKKQISLPSRFEPATRIGEVRIVDKQSQQVVLSGFSNWNYSNPGQDDGLGSAGDSYGHGTFVAGVAAGSGIGSIREGFDYSGLAPAAHLLNVKVLNDDGVGTILDVMAGIDWVIRHKDIHNIRVLNLSLGGLSLESYKKDPLCQMAAAAIDAGIVVVAAAGNYGKDATGQRIYGGITSPAKHPWVIAVGASNTFQTDFRSDDGIASFSSRGPTSVDGLVKPDLLAPGNKLVSVRSPYNRLTQRYPHLAIQVGGDSDTYMELSGTSVSAPVVSGAVALMLETNPSLTPKMVKALLMFTAQHVAGYNIFEQGAGLLNVEGAVRLARLMRPDADRAALGESLLSGDLALGGIRPVSVIAGEEIVWAAPIVYADGILFADCIRIIDGVRFTDGVLFTDGILFADGIWIDGTLSADGILFADSVSFGDARLFASAKIFALEGLWGGTFLDPESGTNRESILAFGVDSDMPSVLWINAASPYYPRR